MPRGRHPRRLKREGERWSKGTPRKKSVHVLCVRCHRAVSFNGWQRHARACFGIRRCFVCSLPFPCPSRRCPWKLAFPAIPDELVPYFRARGRGREKHKAIEVAALRWFATLRLSS